MEWISVKDSLPEYFGRYLVLINNIPSVMKWGCLGTYMVHECWDNHELNAPITHWMEIPKLPDIEAFNLNIAPSDHFNIMGML